MTNNYQLVIFFHNFQSQTWHLNSSLTQKNIFMNLWYHIPHLNHHILNIRPISEKVNDPFRKKRR